MTMDVAVLTIFPEMFERFWTHGIVRRAIEQGQLKGDAIDIRAYAEDRHKAVSYTHLTLPTTCNLCRSRWSPSH